MMPDQIQTLMDAVAVPTLLIRRNRAYAANEAFYQAYGYTHEQVIGHNLFAFIHPDSCAAAFHLHQAARTQAAAHAVLHLQQGDNQIRAVQIHLKSAALVRAGCYMATLTDVAVPHSSGQQQENEELDSLPIGVYRVAKEGLIYVNQTFASLMGYASPEALLTGSRSATHILAETKTTLKEQFRHAPDHTISGMLQMRRYDGTFIWVQHAAHAVTDADGNHLYFEGMVQDITAQKAHITQLEQRNADLETMNQIANLLGQTLNLDECLDQLLHHTQRLIPYTSAAISLIEEHSMQFVATRGLPASVIAILDHVIASRHDASNYGRRVINEQRILIVSETKSDPDWIIRPETDYIRSWMGIPLIYQGEVIGLMTLDHTEPHIYTDDHATRAEAIAHQAAIAIENVRLFEQAQTDIAERERTEVFLVEHLQRMDTLYQVMHMLITADDMGADLPHILRTVQRVLNTESIWLITFDLEMHDVQYLVQYGETDTEPADDFCAILDLDDFKMPDQHLDYPTGRLLRLSNQRHALTAVVMKRGLLTVIRSEEAPPFTVGDRELLVGIANQLTMTLDNQTLYQRLRQQAELLEHRVIESTQQLRLEQRRLQAILDATAEGIIYMEDFVIQYSNSAFSQMLGYAENELIGTSLSQIRKSEPVQKGSRFNFNFSDWDNPLEGNSWNDTLLLHKTGKVVHTNMIFNLIGDPGEDMVRMVAVVRDMSAERSLHLTRMRFVANAAHELRTPLTSFGLRLHMLRRQPERIEIHLASLERVAEYLRSIVEELLDLARFEQGSIMLSQETYVLQSIVEQAAQNQSEYADEREVDVLMEMPEEPIRAYLDSGRFSQLISKLIVNALNYVEKDGRVLVRLNETDFGTQRFIEIQVYDDGQQIDPDLLPTQIFEPFARPSLGSQRETGMGLAIAREIVELHGGEIRVESTSDGNTFTVRMPADRRES